MFSRMIGVSFIHNANDLENLLIIIFFFFSHLFIYNYNTHWTLRFENELGGGTSLNNKDKVDNFLI